jgi:hypothetical protein
MDHLDDLGPEAGWKGAFTRKRHPDALFDNSARIVKVTPDRSGRGVPLGAIGTVLGSTFFPGKGVVYFVEWDEMPRVAVGIGEWKLARIQ